MGFDMTAVTIADAWIQYLTGSSEPESATSAYAPLPPFPAYTPLPPPPTLEATMAATAQWTEQDWQQSKERIAALKEQMRLNELKFEEWRAKHIAVTDEMNRKWDEYMSNRFPVKTKTK
jgi:hypothetical protein